LFILDSADTDPAKIVKGKRVGVDYARHWASAPLRFADAHSKAVSKPRPV
jgi:3-methyladenine DNA glycosylase Mpg